MFQHCRGCLPGLHETEQQTTQQIQSSSLMQPPAHETPQEQVCAYARWFYTKGMHTDKAYMCVGYDSRGEGRPRPGCMPHTATKDPTSSADAPPRRSIECRTMAFWDN